MPISKDNIKNQLFLAIMAITIFGAVTLYRPPAVHAQLGCVGSLLGIDSGGSSISGGVGGNAVPVSDATVRSNTTAQKNVQCTWNGIAWQMAHVVLHSLTTSVVNWINSGFNGSPSFLSNPDQFFLNTADQLTGAFISDSGPLAQSLCSPFSLDLRLSLALGVTQPNQVYTCTLSKVIQAQQNAKAPTLTVNQTQGGATLGDIMNGNVLNNSSMASVNGASINGFMAGDFNQGGWPAFLALTTQPQNNAFGASLQARSDLQAQIQAKQNATNQDLNRGGGFLSWQKCDNVQSSTNAPSFGDAGYGDSTGSITTTKQVCHTETPGSVISSSLNKQLGAPTDELNLTSEINQVVSALFSQLVTHVLSGGLLSSSQSSPGSSATNVTQSYVNQLSNDPQMQANFTSLQQQAVATFSSYAAPAQQALTYRTQALAAITQQQTAYSTTANCLQDLLTKSSSDSAASTHIQSDIDAINSAVSSTIAPAISKYQGLIDGTQSALTNIQNMQYQLQAATTAQQLSSLSTDFSTAVVAQQTSLTDPQAAKSDLADATKTATSLQTALVPYQNTCNAGTWTSAFQ